MLAEPCMSACCSPPENGVLPALPISGFISETAEPLLIFQHTSSLAETFQSNCGERWYGPCWTRDWTTRAKVLGPNSSHHQGDSQSRAASFCSGQLWDFYWILLLVKIQQQQFHMLPLFSEWARIKGATLKQAMCVHRLSGYLQMHGQYHHSSCFCFLKKILIAENNGRKKNVIVKGIFVLWYLQREDSCCSIISLDFQRDVALCWMKTLPTGKC